MNPILNFAAHELQGMADRSSFEKRNPFDQSGTA
jgi:hypothetical protein